VRLRGGMPKEPDWVRTPTQPTIIISTVDQVGSRVFFRGYGVSDSMKPVHAGLLGVDTLVLLDEAHLSQPFVETLRAAQSVRKPAAETGVPRVGDVVTLSATQTVAQTFRITGEDRANEQLRGRLMAAKPTELLRAPGGEDSDTHLDKIAEKAVAMSVVRGGDCSVVGVVVNRVARARRVLERIERMLLRQAVGLADVALLIGRCRDLDRDQVLQEILPRMSAGRAPQTQPRPLFVIATQCIEAGADLDFDGLVSDLAPLDSLRQRFGRLNRMGRRPTAPAVIVTTGDQLRTRAADPIYGPSSRETWALLEANATKAKVRGGERMEIDMGIDASVRWLPAAEKLAPYLAPKKQAPVLLPAYFDAWTHTSPVPDAEAGIPLFLHGPDSGPPDVEIVWRADLVEHAGDGEWEERVAVCPPSSLEALAVPIWEAQAWLREAASADIVDLEGTPTPDEDRRGIRGHRALRWRGIDGDTGVILAADLRPGDRIVVPASRGGCDRWGWNPNSQEIVRDLGTEANAKQRGWNILRLSAELAAASDPQVHRARVRDLVDSLRTEGDKDAYEAIRNRSSSPTHWRAYASQGRFPMVVRSEQEGQEGMILAFQRKSGAAGDAVTEDDDSVKGRTGRKILLSSHSKGVRDRAAEMARSAGVPDNLVADIALAAFLHDAGKAHPQFRAWLYGGDVLLGEAAPALAKSGRQLGRDARVRSGLPLGARHEVASLRFAGSHPAFSRAHDPELVLWLIGTHHGYGRPFFPPVAWPPQGDVFTADLDDGSGEIVSRPGPQIENVSSGWIDSFERLNRRYGPWGLAWLEAVLRLADHRRSEAEQEGDGP
jgi:CRISPR-associated endonuclease/helicase Cas3